MAGRGGKRINAGRKTKAEELKSSAAAISAINSRYGSLELGFVALMESEEPVLIKFVFEHAAGKPQDVVDITTDGEKLQTSPNLSDAQLNKLLAKIDEKSDTR